VRDGEGKRVGKGIVVWLGTGDRDGVGATVGAGEVTGVAGGLVWR
jgi:hypothetical protein